MGLVPLGTHFSSGLIGGAVLLWAKYTVGGFSRAMAADFEDVPLAYDNPVALQ